MVTQEKVEGLPELHPKIPGSCDAVALGLQGVGGLGLLEDQVNPKKAASGSYMP